MSRRLFFPILLDGGNRGCEGIAKGTAIILNYNKDKMIGLSSDLYLDIFLGTNKYYNLEKQRSTIKNRILNKIFRVFRISYQLIYNPKILFLNGMNKDDIMISTGGDMLCYDTDIIVKTNNFVYKKGNKSILWGCSMGSENLTAAKKETLEKFSYIYTRDSLTFDFFKSIGLKNVVCYPDPAFILKPEKFQLPSFFHNKKIVGLNISNFTLGSDTSIDSPFGKELKNLMNYILAKTEYDIVLIPHVFWKGQDDRILSLLLMNEFNNFERIHLLESENLNYLQIRYAISKCKLFIGARTHAMISAYATCIPSLALGYSIKSKGIAKDLGLKDLYVFNTKNFKEGDLIKAFINLDNEKENLKYQLQTTIPSYSVKAYEAKNILSEI